MRQKVTTFYFLLLTLAFYRASAQAPPVFDWHKCLGGTGADVPSRIIESSDNGYYIIGTAGSNNGNVTGNHGMSDVWVVKTDASSNILWAKCFGGSNADAGVTAVEFANGKLFVLANTNSTNGNVTNPHGFTDVWMLCLDTAGTLLWQRTYGGGGDDMGNALLVTSDQHLLLGCSSGSSNGDITNPHGGDDFWLLKVDTLGNIAWQKSLGGSGLDACYALQETSDGGYIAGGGSNSQDGDITSPAGQFDFWVTKTDVSGNLLWEKSHGGSANDCAFTMIQNDGGNYVLGGYSNSSDYSIDNHGGSDFWVCEIDPSGNMVNQFSFGGGNSDIAFSIVRADADGYLLSGSSYSHDFDLERADILGGEEAWLMKTDINGNLVWSRTYGGSQNDRVCNAIQTADGGYIIAGRSNSATGQVSGNHGSFDIWISKLSCLSPAASFTFADDTVCVNLLVDFTNTSIQSAAYSWQADGIEFNYHTDASFQFPAAGTYEISLIGSTCYASDTTKHTFVVIDHVVPTITAPQNFLCSNTLLNLSTDYANGYEWSTGETTATIHVSTPGAYFVIADRHGCIDTSSVFQVADQSVAPFSLGADTEFCAGTNFPLYAPAGYVSYTWQNGYTNPVYYAPAAGTYYVEISNGFCTQTDTIVLTTRTCTLPVPDFTTSQNSICAGTCIDFINMSQYVDSCVWIFEGAGTGTVTSNATNPAGICYLTPGTYSVELNVYNANGFNSLTRIGYITVNELPVAPAIYAFGNTVQPDSIISSYSYQWYYQGNPVPGATNAMDTVEWDGNYQLLVTNSNGCSSLSDPVYVQFTSVKPVNDLASVSFYPNPADAYIHIMLTGYESGSPDANVRLFDSAGRQVLSVSIPGNAATEKLDISLADLESGIYFIQVPGLENSGLVKVLVQH